MVPTFTYNEILGYPMGGTYSNTGILLCGSKLCEESRTKLASALAWYPKRKLGVRILFSEIIKFNLEKNVIHSLFYSLL